MNVVKILCLGNWMFALLINNPLAKITIAEHKELFYLLPTVGIMKISLHEEENVDYTQYSLQLRWLNVILKVMYIAEPLAIK